MRRTALLAPILFSLSSSSRAHITRMASSNSSTSSVPTSEEEWRSRLSPFEYRVLREKATEPGGYSIRTEGALENTLKKRFGTAYPERGGYVCAGCGQPLYYAKHKFSSGCGWPAFYDYIDGAVKEVPDADGHRIEIVCSKCNGHLGHIFKGEGFRTPTNERSCVNGVSIRYVEDLDQPEGLFDGTKL